ncbi:MAG: histone deacetylase [candidate division Zixibacteria bacterium]|nr:histone deacetylase [candidate division Zixibacteria bacterium]
MLKIYHDPAFLKHDTGAGHPESADRLKAVKKAFEIVPEANIESECPYAQQADIELVHAPEYYKYINSQPNGRLVMLDPDTVFSPASLEASLKAAGAVIDAVKFAVSDKNNRAFCAVRPPGHHAETDKTKGFCIFNNIAIGAAYAIANNLAERVAIIDWDVHHGNGTQNTFYDSSQVLYISLHQYPYYPGSGAANETGRGEGTGYTLNLPMSSGNGDTEYRRAFNDLILPALEKFKPNLIMISAGFDAHTDDPLAGIKLSTEFYSEMTRMLVEAAAKYCQGGIVSVFEGGYNLKVLAESVMIHLKELSIE